VFKVDLNSDLGESFGVYRLGNDEAVLESVTSANVACGFHAGDPKVMIETVRLAKKAGAAVGAHPGHPDLVGFGRRALASTPEEVYAYVLYQVGAIQAACRAQGVTLQHVKAHGALYNQAVKDEALALAIARAVKDAGEGIILMGLANSAFEGASAEAGVPFAAEAFADRAYEPDGSLVSRKKEGAVIHDVDLAAGRVLRMLKEGTVEAVDGSVVSIRPQTICLHGDTPEAVEMARKLRRKLETEGVVVRPLKEVMGL